MRKYGILLLVIAIALASAPAAMAKCQRCKPILLACGDAATGWEYCEWTWDHNCITHTACPAFQAGTPAEDLASEFKVASVERLDGRQPVPLEKTGVEARVASLETPAPAPQR